MKLTGKVWKFPQSDINTGLIRKQMYNHLPPQEQGKHCMEALDPEFATKVKPGDFIVAGTNFGCGSSTPAHYSIVALGIPAVIAESFGALFFSNCAGGALWPVVCPGILGLVETGDTLEIDTDTFEVRNVATGKTLRGKQLPEIYRGMIQAGGEKPYLKARLTRQAMGR
jgi:3-isopropylmalate/(R)-2-methylmalate dehydratase small subunit